MFVPARQPGACICRAPHPCTRTGQYPPSQSRRRGRQGAAPPGPRSLFTDKTLLDLRNQTPPIRRGQALGFFDNLVDGVHDPKPILCWRPWFRQSTRRRALWGGRADMRNAISPHPSPLLARARRGDFCPTNRGRPLTEGASRGEGDEGALARRGWSVAGNRGASRVSARGSPGVYPVEWFLTRMR